MKYLRDPVLSEIYAYEADGSQDAYIDPRLVPVGSDELATLLAPSPESILAALTQAVQGHLDTAARQYRYDNIHTACGWAGEFADATDLKAWAAECWRVAGSIEAAVMSGARPAQTVDELLAELPVFRVSAT